MTKIKNVLNQLALEFKSISFDSNIPLDTIKPVSHSKIPSWKLLKPEIDTSFAECKKT